MTVLYRTLSVPLRLRRPFVCSRILVLAEKVTLGLGVAAFLFIAMWIMGSRKLRKSEAYIAYKAAKLNYKKSKKSK